MSADQELAATGRASVVAAGIGGIIMVVVGAALTLWRKIAKRSAERTKA